MNSNEKSPLSETYLPFLASPELTVNRRINLLRQLIGYRQIPFMSRWLIYRALW